jgi:hypothetical protein
VNIFFNERTQYLLFALAQWYHLLIHPQNIKLCSYDTSLVNDDC